MCSTEHHRILLVEDDAAQREPLALLLVAQGYAVTSTASGHEALEAIAGGLRPCLIVLDFTMPGMDGGEFLRRHRERDGSAPAVLYSGECDLASHAGRLGVPHVRKPDIDRLFQFIARF